MTNLYEHRFKKYDRVWVIKKDKIKEGVFLHYEYYDSIPEGIRSEYARVLVNDHVENVYTLIKYGDVEMLTIQINKLKEEFKSQYEQLIGRLEVNYKVTCDTYEKDKKDD